jgi:hypothetical protein
MHVMIIEPTPRAPSGTGRGGVQVRLPVSRLLLLLLRGTSLFDQDDRAIGTIGAVSGMALALLFPLFCSLARRTQPDPAGHHCRSPLLSDA